jgi:hypothetical protein
MTTRKNPARSKTGQNRGGKRASRSASTKGKAPTSTPHAVGAGDANEASARRAENEAGVRRAQSAMGLQGTSAGDTRTMGERGAVGPDYTMGATGPRSVDGSSAAGRTDAAAEGFTAAKEVVAEVTPGASHGALHVLPDTARGQVDPIAEGGRPQGGGSPVLGEHVPGDTEFLGSRGRADRSPPAAKGALPRGFTPGKSPMSEQRDAAWDVTNRRNQAYDLDAEGKPRQAKPATKPVKLLFVVTDKRDHGPADQTPNATTAILKAAPPGLSKENAEFFAVSPSGTIALNAFDNEHADLFAIGTVFEVTLTPRKAKGPAKSPSKSPTLKATGGSPKGKSPTTGGKKPAGTKGAGKKKSS